MVKIAYVRIQRYRSIMDLKFLISSEINLISICGQNNVGKTNVLRALNLFFYPETYEQKNDMPNLKKATLGSSIYPKIELTFYDDDKELYYHLSRNLKPQEGSISSITGYSHRGTVQRNREKKELSSSEIESFLNKISFVYIESINTLVPHLIDSITQDILSLEYDRARFSKNKKTLKDAYDTYVDGLQDILDKFSDGISTTFQEFRPNWNIEFRVPKSSDSFRDLISDDVTLQVKDRGSDGIENKGAGLQRLAHILMEFEAASMVTSKKSVIICIDEPDIYLHEGLQRKLKLFFDKKSKEMQIFCTTHSKVFIDTYKMTNTLLLSCEMFEKYVVRKGKDVDVMETILLERDSDEGYKSICEHLGIEVEEHEVLQKNNILVEGNSDKKYLEELAKYYNVELVNIIPANGADNMQKYLEFYNSFYLESPNKKPKIKLILDNDTKGRDVFNKLSKKKYDNIEATFYLLPNYMNDAEETQSQNNINNEMEDFIYPELVCFLINSILEKKNMKSINVNTICRKSSQKSFRSGGILSICEHEKNTENPDNGVSITFTSSGMATNSIKESLAGLMKIEGNHKLIKVIDECNKTYPFVCSYVKQLFDFSD